MTKSTKRGMTPIDDIIPKVDAGMKSAEEIMRRRDPLEDMTAISDIFDPDEYTDVTNMFPHDGDGLPEPDDDMDDIADGGLKPGDVAALAEEEEDQDEDD